MAKKKCYDRSVIKKLDAIDWPAIMPELIKYAREKEALLIAVNSDMVCIDIAREAIARVYGQGKNDKYRNWDSAKYPDLVKFLKYIINDIVRREVARLTGYKTEKLCWENEPGEERALSVSPYDSADAHQSKTPEALIIEMEVADRLIKTLDDISQEDEDLGYLIICIEEGKTKAAQIADETGLDIKKVYNLRRKLKRRLERYKGKYGMTNNSERKAGWTPARN